MIVFGVPSRDFDFAGGNFDLGGGDSLTLTFLAGGDFDLDLDFLTFTFLFGGESLPVEVEAEGW